MTREDYLDLLRLYDDPYLECPETFEYGEDDYRRVMLLVQCLERPIGSPCEVLTGYGNYIQDASFHTMISLPTVGASDVPVYVLKLSNFGNLASVHEKSLDPLHLQAALSCLSKLGYQYIPSEVLSEKYDGVIVELRGITWHKRYFDWQ
jgi:hypothetical protein